MNLAAEHILPADADDALLVGRCGSRASAQRLSSAVTARCLTLPRRADGEPAARTSGPAGAVRDALPRRRGWLICGTLANCDEATRNPGQPWLLAPCDCRR